MSVGVEGSMAAVVMAAIVVFLFFFQAEDGIRDGTVTGVQTCALPISHRRVGDDARVQPGIPDVEDPGHRGPAPGAPDLDRVDRSEERRVGKECRSRWWP